MSKLPLVANCLAGYRKIILGYHSISDNPRDPWSVSKQNFLSQMQWLRKNNFSVVSLGELLKDVKQNRNRRRTVTLTFDDGYVDFLENAVPILKSFGFHATVFVPAGMIGGRSEWDSFDKYKSVADWAQLREMLRAGHTIGGHGLIHVNLTKLNDHDLIREVEASKEILETGLDTKVDCFSYPFGSFTEREIGAVRKAGYVCALANNSYWGNDNQANLFALERVFVRREDSLDAFGHKVDIRKKMLRRILREVSLRVGGERVLRW